MILAAAFAFHGSGLLRSLERFRARVVWARDVPDPLLRFIGTAEVLGALGLVLPALTRVAPGLTAVAAAGFVVLMLVAITFHATRREWPNIGLNFILGALAVFVAYGRLAVVPLS